MTATDTFNEGFAARNFGFSAEVLRFESNILVLRITGTENVGAAVDEMAISGLVVDQDAPNPILISRNVAAILMADGFCWL